MQLNSTFHRVEEQLKCSVRASIIFYHLRMRYGIKADNAAVWKPDFNIVRDTLIL